jgi:formylmethanofuran dehydrogenase subunit E-like metal-binding protein
MVMHKKNNCLYGLVTIICFTFIFFIPSISLSASSKEYRVWKAIGARVAWESSRLTGQRLGTGEPIALTNAGYAEIEGHSTQGCMDGLTWRLGVTRGSNTLLEIHSRYDKALWFFIYYKKSGVGVYLEVNPEVIPKLVNNTDKHGFSQIAGNKLRIPASQLFTKTAVERIKAEHLFANIEEYNEKFANKIFGGNEFRIVTIANAVAAGAPAYAIRAFEFHDHFCPGVLSGILMVNYIKECFPLQSPDDRYFVLTVEPWCKEDALLVLLDTTPGKKGYAVSYPNEEDIAQWKEEARDAATIIFRQDGATEKWEGRLLGFSFDKANEMHEFPDYGSDLLNKLYSDLWYLDYFDQPELFVSVIKEFELAEGEDPKDWARPGVNPLEKLDLIQD